MLLVEQELQSTDDLKNAAQGLTCICPSNEAFADFGNLDDSTGNLTDGPASLLATLTRHGLTGSYYTTNFTEGDLIYSQNGYPILVTLRNGSIWLNDARLIGTNFIAKTGAVHAVDRVSTLLWELILALYNSHLAGSLDLQLDL